MAARTRVGEFLLNLLADPKVARYQAALGFFERWCEVHSVAWDQMDEAQDLTLSDYVLEGYDDGRAVASARGIASALQKRSPRRRFTTTWRVIRGWASLAPPDRAPPMPQELALALAVLGVASGRAPASCASAGCCGWVRC